MAAISKFLFETSFGEFASQHRLAVRAFEGRQAFFGCLELAARVFHRLLHHFFSKPDKTLFKGGAQSLHFLLNYLSKISGHVDTAR